MIKTCRDIHDEDLSRASVKEELRRIAEEHKYLTGWKRNEDVVEAAARRIADDYRTGSGDVEVSTINSVSIIGDCVADVPAADFRAVSLRDPKLVELILRLRGEE